MAIVAMVLVVGFSAFKMSETQKEDRHWFSLNPQGDLIGPTDEHETCLEVSNIYCAVGFLEDPGTNIPANLDDIDPSEDIVIMYKPF